MGRCYAYTGKAEIPQLIWNFLHNRLKDRLLDKISKRTVVGQFEIGLGDESLGFQNCNMVFHRNTAPPEFPALFLGAYHLVARHDSDLPSEHGRTDGIGTFLNVFESQ